MAKRPTLGRIKCDDLHAVGAARVNSQELQDLTRERVRDAKALLAYGQWPAPIT
jgi:hypothetical protein